MCRRGPRATPASTICDATQQRPIASSQQYGEYVRDSTPAQCFYFCMRSGFAYAGLEISQDWDDHTKLEKFNNNLDSMDKASKGG